MRNGQESVLKKIGVEPNFQLPLRKPRFDPNYSTYDVLTMVAIGEEWAKVSGSRRGRRSYGLNGSAVSTLISFRTMSERTCETPGSLKMKSSRKRL